MSWIQAWPPGTTSVASTRPQFQQNNLYIQNIFRRDHYFANAVGDNDGHHQFVQMPDSAGDPAVAAGMDGVLYLNDTPVGAAPAPFLNTSQVFSIPVGIRAGNFVLINGDNNTFNFATVPTPQMVGWIYAYDIADPRKSIGTNFFWNGVTVLVNYRNNGDGQWIADGGTGGLVQFRDATNSFINIRTTAIMTVDITIMGILV